VRSPAVTGAGKEEPRPTANRTRLFLDALARFPSGVTIVTTASPDGCWWGFTATAFCAVSKEPPLVLVCLAKSAECHPVFEQSQNWVIHVLHDDHVNLAVRFATRGADKFAETEFATDELGQPLLGDASVTLRCSLYARQDAGDHTILLGRVDDARIGSAQPVVYYERAFHPLPDWASS
jgi:flavin reductase ActVB